MTKVFICVGAVAYEGNGDPLAAFHTLKEARDWWRVDAKTKKEGWDCHRIYEIEVGQGVVVNHEIWTSRHWREV